MYDPTMRVLTVLELLQSLERVTGAQLAERLEVHPRTVQRYISRLQDLGVPVVGSRGKGGAYRLKPGFHLPPMMFTDEEALALLLGLRALLNLGLSAFAPALEGARAKLRRAMPVLFAERIHQIQKILELDTPWMVEANASQVIELASAVHERKVACITYSTKRAELSRRDVEPYGVIRDDGRWYLVGYCRLREAIRCFRVDRIESIQILDEAFEPPSNFDARDTLLESLAKLPSVWQVDVWAELPLEKVRVGLPLLRPVLKVVKNGTSIQCGVEDLESFAVQILGLGCGVIIHHPPDLKKVFERLSQRARCIAQSILKKSA